MTAPAALLGPTRERRPDLVGRLLRAGARHLGFLEDELAGLAELVGPGDVCLDVGAEYGLYTWALAGLVGPTGGVHAVEPQPGLARWLRHSVRRLDASAVRVHELALGADRGAGTLALPYRRGLPVHGRAFLTTGADGLGSNAEFARHHDVAVPVTTLDALVTQVSPERLDFVKVDVEGAESALLDGARATIARHAPTLLVEVEDRHSRRFGRTVADVVHRLDDLGYTPWAYSPERGWTPYRLGDPRRNVLFRPGARW